MSTIELQMLAGAPIQATQPEDAVNRFANVKEPLLYQLQDTYVIEDQHVRQATLALQHAQIEQAEVELRDAESQRSPPYDTASQLHIDRTYVRAPAPISAVAAVAGPSATQAEATNGSAVMLQQCGDPPLQLPPRQVCRQWIGAAKAGDSQTLQRLYQQHPLLLNHQPQAGLQCSALHWVAANGHAEAMLQLLLWGADPCLLTATGSSCLHSAAAANRQECVELLLKVPQVLQHVDLANEDGLTAAGAAGRHGHKVVQGMILDAAARVAGGKLSPRPPDSNQSQLSAVSEPSNCALQVKQQHKKPSGLRPGFLNDGKTAKQPSKRVPVDFAAAARNVQDPSPPHVDIHQAQGGHVDDTSITEMQGISGIDAIASSTGRGWLDAARRGDLPTMKSQLAEQPQLLEYCGSGTSYAFTGNTALHWSAAKGHMHVVQWLLQQGVSVQCVNQAGETALHTAVGHGQAGCAEVLVLVGAADVAVQDGLGQSAAQLAAAADCGALAANLLMWSLMRIMAASDRSSWTVQQMQQMLRLAGKSAEAAVCVDRSEMVHLVQDVLQGHVAPQHCR